MWRQQAEVVDRLIGQLGAAQTPCIRVYNKCDLVPLEFIPHEELSVRISARTGEGTADLLELIEKTLDTGKKRVTLHLPYDKGEMLELIHRFCEVHSVDYEAEFSVMDITVPSKNYAALKPYIFEQGKT